MSHPAVAALGAMALLMLVQLFFAVAVSTRAQHIPGTTAAGGHDDPFFRATRTVANTNETIAIFILAVMFCIMSGAAEHATAQAAWAFVDQIREGWKGRALSENEFYPAGSWGPKRSDELLARAGHAWREPQPLQRTDQEERHD